MNPPWGLVDSPYGDLASLPPQVFRQGPPRQAGPGLPGVIVSPGSTGVARVRVMAWVSNFSSVPIVAVIPSPVAVTVQVTVLTPAVDGASNVVDVPVSGSRLPPPPTFQE